MYYSMVMVSMMPDWIYYEGKDTQVQKDLKITKKQPVTGILDFWSVNYLVLWHMLNIIFRRSMASFFSTSQFLIIFSWSLYFCRQCITWIYPHWIPEYRNPLGPSRVRPQITTLAACTNALCGSLLLVVFSFLSQPRRI